jgi:hypothetical protein
VVAERQAVAAGSGRSARVTGAHISPPHDACPREAAPLNAVPTRRRDVAESVAGLMAAAALFVSLLGLVHRPVRVLPAAILVALVAVAIGGRHQRLALFAAAVAAFCWVVGLTIAVATNHPLY